MGRIYHVDGARPDTGQIFVFGSNTAGIHAGGAAWAAQRFYGAEKGVAEGPTGNCYAIPTVLLREAEMRSLTVTEIRPAIERFAEHAKAHPDQFFFITRIGCGIAGNKDIDIAPIFRGAPINRSFPRTWELVLEGHL